MGDSNFSDEGGRTEFQQSHIKRDVKPCRLANIFLEKGH